MRERAIMFGALLLLAFVVALVLGAGTAVAVAVDELLEGVTLEE